MPNDRYVRKCYDMLYHFDALGYKYWALEIRNILSINGFLYVWENQGVENEGAFLGSFEHRLKDKFLQVWKSKIDESSDLSFYTQIKIHHCLESYLDILKIHKFRNALASFRISCHVLEIEKGRHRGIERENRKCRFCPNSLEDDYHFMLTCKQYEDLRWEYNLLNIFNRQIYINLLFSYLRNKNQL